MLIREQYQIRNYRPDDVPALVDLYNRYYAALGDDRRYTEGELRLFLDAPQIQPETDVFVVEDAGRLISYIDVELSPAGGRSWSEGVVDPDYWRQGIGAELIRLAEARVLARAAEVPADVPLVMDRYALDLDQAAFRLFEAQGYTRVRTFYQMHIELDQPVEAPPLPDGLVLRPFNAETDAYAVYEAHEEAFEDHWGFQRDTYDEWAHRKFHHPLCDLSAWLIAYDGDEIAGMCLNRGYGVEDPEMMWVETLGVRRQWRRRGLAFALLRQSFALFQQRGYKRAGLGVDASSLTNAVALYERAGMHIAKRTHDYRKVLRGEPAL